MIEDVYNVFKEKTVLVTGGAGAIGSNLVKKLNDLGTRKILILDDLSSSYRWNIPISKKIQFIEGSILDDKKLNLVFKKKPVIIYHLAAHFANQNSVENPEEDLLVNGMGILKVLEYCQKHTDQRLDKKGNCPVCSLDTGVDENLCTKHNIPLINGECESCKKGRGKGKPIPKDEEKRLTEESKLVNRSAQ